MFCIWKLPWPVTMIQLKFHLKYLVFSLSLPMLMRISDISRSEYLHICRIEFHYIFVKMKSNQWNKYEKWWFCIQIHPHKLIWKFGQHLQMKITNYYVADSITNICLMYAYGYEELWILCVLDLENMNKSKMGIKKASIKLKTCINCWSS